MAAAQRYRAKEINRYQRFLFKDPRTCLLIPFWKAAFGEMIYVVTLRNPDDVVRSLVRRQNAWLAHSRFWWRWARNSYHLFQGAREPIRILDETKAHWLYNVYYDRVLSDLYQDHVVPVIYEDLIANPWETVNYIVKALGGDDSHVNTEMVQGDLNHGRQSRSNEVVRYYERLRETCFAIEPETHFVH
jgi:LPS sulfotransferase NodH